MTRTRQQGKKAKAKPSGKTAAKPPRRKPLCLVTGACGFIGSHMVEVLHQAGYRIRATDLPDAYSRDDQDRGRFPSVLKDLGIEFVPSDVTNPETLPDAVKGVSYVFHIAAVFSYSAPWEVLKRVNVDGTRELCRVLAGEKAFRKLVLWGAGGVYGFPPADSLPIREDDPKAPPNNYLKSKHEQERLVIQIGRKTGLRYSIVRPTGVYGPRGVYGMAKMILPLAKQKRLFMPWNLTTRVPLVHVRDVCEAALFLAKKKASDGEAYNLNDDTQMTVVEYMQHMGDVFGKPVTLLPPVPVSLMKALLNRLATLEALVSKFLVNRPRSLEPDTIQYLGVDIAYSNQKLKDAGYRFLYPDARAGLRETVDWYRRSGWIA
jgi:nucleoside-diphosphate-sugar epimerase